MKVDDILLVKIFEERSIPERTTIWKATLVITDVVENTRDIIEAQEEVIYQQYLVMISKIFMYSRLMVTSYATRLTGVIQVLGIQGFATWKFQKLFSNGNGNQTISISEVC